MPRKYSMDTRTQHTEATRARLLDSVTEVLAEKGIEGLTMQAVAEHADTAVRTVYNHFATKEALVVEAFERLAQDVMAIAGTLHGPGTPMERLLQFVDDIYDVFEAQGPGAGAVLNVAGIEAFEARLKEVRSWRRGELTTVLKQAQKDGSLTMALKPALALAFLFTAYAMWHSLVIDSGLTLAVAKHLAKQTLTATIFGG